MVWLHEFTHWHELKWQTTMHELPPDFVRVERKSAQVWISDNLAGDGDQEYRYDRLFLHQREYALDFVLHTMTRTATGRASAPYIETAGDSVVFSIDKPQISPMWVNVFYPSLVANWFTVQSQNWDEANREYYRNLARRTIGRALLKHIS